MQNFDFNKVTYRRPFLSGGVSTMKGITGFDSETLTTGKPFMFCTSKGDNFTLQDIPECFFTRKYRGSNFMTYNLKFDSGSIIYDLPLDVKNTLRVELTARHNGYSYKYIPHKYLRISKGKHGVNFWDLQPFFKSSLDNASKTYLNRRKLRVETKSFTPEYVKKHYNKIKKYCIRDAELTRDLGRFLIRKLKRLGITVNSLYSPASISFAWFRVNGDIITSWRFWELYRGLLRYACEAYAGGKFEVTARGKFKGYEYDIVSAYPYEIQNLYDITRSRIVYSKKYHRRALYAFMRCRIDNSGGVNLPTGVNEKGTRVYPAGVFHATITKTEYDYMIMSGVRVKIISAYWLFKSSCRQPYRERIQKLYELKARYSKSDRMLYNIVKIMMNSFYGKMVQINKKPDGELEAGIGWNVIYGAIITANVRVRMTVLQEYLRRDCLCVHTDSVITLKKLPDWMLSNDLGGLQLEKAGKGVIVGCGLYQIGKKAAERGFKAHKGVNWLKTLKSVGKKGSFQHTETRVCSWFGACEDNKPEMTNRFMKVQKTIDFNVDKKRLWLNRATGKRLLSKLEYSIPHIYYDRKRQK